MNYRNVNQELAKHFGKGQVEVRKAKNQNWEYTLWFLSDNPSNATIKKAQNIVDTFQPTLWMNDKIFHSN